MQVQFNGRILVFQTSNEGSIPFTCSIWNGKFVFKILFHRELDYRRQNLNSNYNHFISIILRFVNSELHCIFFSKKKSAISFFMLQIIDSNFAGSSETWNNSLMVKHYANQDAGSNPTCSHYQASTIIFLFMATIVEVLTFLSVEIQLFCIGFHC